MAKKSVAKIGKSPFDAEIIRLFAEHKSAEEVADIINVPSLTPAKCLQRLTQLVRSKDALEVSDQLGLLLEDNYYLRNRLRQQMDDSQWIDKDAAASWLKTTEAIVKRIETVNIGANEAMMRFNALRAAEFVDALTYITKIAVEALEAKHPEIEAADIQMIVLDSIPEAIPSTDD